MPTMTFRTAVIASIVALTCTACASLKPDITASRSQPEQVNWPDGYLPEDASFFVHNEIDIDAPPEIIWELLVKAEDWSNWYDGASNIDIRGNETSLQPGSVFDWRTMGLTFESTITEFVPYERLSWESEKSLIRGYHAWLILPTDTGSKVITAESQRGFLSVMERIFQPNKLRKLHDVWLQELKRLSEQVRAQS